MFSSLFAHTYVSSGSGPQPTTTALKFTSASTSTYSYTFDTEYSTDGGSTWVALSYGTTSPSMSEWLLRGNNAMGGRFTLYGDDVSISGRITDLQDNGTGTATSIPDYGCEFMFPTQSNVTSVNLTLGNVRSVDQWAFYNMFNNCHDLTTATIDLSYCTSVGMATFYQMFQNCYGLTTASVDLSNLTTIGSASFQEMFIGCGDLVTASVDLSKITSIGEYAFDKMFYNCESLEGPIYVPASPYSSGTSSACEEMFYDSGTTHPVASTTPLTKCWIKPASDEYITDWEDYADIDSTYWIVSHTSPEPTTTYTVTASATNGSVSGAGQYTSGSTCTLTFSPSSGYQFDSTEGWKVNGVTVSTSNPYSFTVTGDVSVSTVGVGLTTYTITATGTNGSVTGDGTYYAGQTCTLIFSPNSGYAFDTTTGWVESGSTVSTSNPYSFTVTGNRTISTTGIAGTTYYSVSGCDYGNGTYVEGSTVTCGFNSRSHYLGQYWCRKALRDKRVLVADWTSTQATGCVITINNISQAHSFSTDGSIEYGAEDIRHVTIND